MLEMPTGADDADADDDADSCAAPERFALPLTSPDADAEDADEAEMSEVIGTCIVAMGSEDALPTSNMYTKPSAEATAKSSGRTGLHRTHVSAVVVMVITVEEDDDDDDDDDEITDDRDGDEPGGGSGVH